MDLIDTHQHLILRDRLGYRWTSAISALASGDFTPGDYAASVLGKGITGSLFMETGVDDADYQAEARLIAGFVRKGGMMGQIASCRPETDKAFDAWLDECEGLHVKGFRRILHVGDDGISQSGTFRRNLRKIGQRGLPFDLCVLARQHDLVEDLTRTHDHQIFVLDHCGNPDIAADAFAPWAASLCRLAALPNLYAKLSGITANCAPGTVTVDRLRPYVLHLIDCFGPERIVWGSDWPVVTINSTLPDWVDFSRTLLAPLTVDERRAIGSETARKIYQL
ncbi:MAG: amidohydrolase family protein [Paracoccaceae bacterium]